MDQIPNVEPRRNTLQQFIAKFQKDICGVMSGFDRVLFRGSLRRLTHSLTQVPLHAQVSRGSAGFAITLQGVAVYADDSLLVTRRVQGSEIYAWDWVAP